MYSASISRMDTKRQELCQNQFLRFDFKMLHFFNSVITVPPLGQSDQYGYFEMGCIIPVSLIKTRPVPSEASCLALKLFCIAASKPSAEIHHPNARLNQTLTKNPKPSSKRNGSSLGTIYLGHSLLSHIAFGYGALYYC